MIFKTPCFVCIEDAATREELLAWLQQIGYNVYAGYWGEYIRFIRCWTPTKGIGKAVGYPNKHVRRTDIDCGKNIELFKALAAMNDDNDLEQWFTGELNGEQLWWKCNQSDKRERYLKGTLLHKATVDEIVKRYKSIGVESK